MYCNWKKQLADNKINDVRWGFGIATHLASENFILYMSGAPYREYVFHRWFALFISLSIKPSLSISLADWSVCLSHTSLSLLPYATRYAKQSNVSQINVTRLSSWWWHSVVSTCKQCDVSACQSNNKGNGLSVVSYHGGDANAKYDSFIYFFFTLCRTHQNGMGNEQPKKTTRRCQANKMYGGTKWVEK